MNLRRFRMCQKKLGGKIFFEGICLLFMDLGGDCDVFLTCWKIDWSYNKKKYSGDVWLNKKFYSFLQIALFCYRITPQPWLELLFKLLWRNKFMMSALIKKNVNRVGKNEIWFIVDVELDESSLVCC